MATTLALDFHEYFPRLPASPPVRSPPLWTFGRIMAISSAMSSSSAMPPSNVVTNGIARPAISYAALAARAAVPTAYSPSQGTTPSLSQGTTAASSLSSTSGDDKDEPQEEWPAIGSPGFLTPSKRTPQKAPHSAATPNLKPANRHRSLSRSSVSSNNSSTAPRAPRFQRSQGLPPWNNAPGSWTPPQRSLVIQPDLENDPDFVVRRYFSPSLPPPNQPFFAPPMPQPSQPVDSVPFRSPRPPYIRPTIPLLIGPEPGPSRHRKRVPPRTWESDAKVARIVDPHIIDLTVSHEKLSDVLDDGGGWSYPPCAPQKEEEEEQMPIRERRWTFGSVDFDAESPMRPPPPPLPLNEDSSSCHKSQDSESSSIGDYHSSQHPTPQPPFEMFPPAPVGPPEYYPQTSYYAPPGPPAPNYYNPYQQPPRRFQPSRRPFRGNLHSRRGSLRGRGGPPHVYEQQHPYYYEEEYVLPPPMQAFDMYPPVPFYPPPPDAYAYPPPLSATYPLDTFGFPPPTGYSYSEGPVTTNFNIIEESVMKPGSVFVTRSSSPVMDDHGEGQNEKLKKQVEYYLSEENLRSDLWLRRNMDTEGYIPLSLVLSFPRVKAILRRQEGEDMLARLLQSSDELTVNMDTDGQRWFVRPKQKWSVWILGTAQPSTVAAAAVLSPSTNTENAVAREEGSDDEVEFVMGSNSLDIVFGAGYPTPRPNVGS